MTIRRMLLSALLVLGSFASATPLLALEATTIPDTDPARLTEAKRTIDFVFPLGTYRKLMGSSFSRMMGGISDKMLDMPVKDVIAMGGAAPAEVASMSDATMRQVMEVVDPVFGERNRRMFDSMMAGMSDVMNGFEPEIRDALAGAYAAKFTTPQLREINGFFTTPTGSLYARSAVTLAMDPAYIDKMMKLTPRLMQAMPQIMQAATAKTRDLPPRKPWSTLSQPERDKLIKLLDLPAEQAQRAVDALEKQQNKKESAAS